MSVWNIFLCGMVLVLTGMLFYKQRSERKLLERLSKMLYSAMNGSYEESRYDESIFSALETALAQYLSASKLSANEVSAERDRIKTLIADISHQTKTPIANILLYGELLEEMELPIQGQQVAGEMKRQAEKLQFLIDVLVKMSRLEAGVIEVHPVEHEVKELLEAVGEDILPKAREKGIALVVEGGTANAMFDMKWTREALYNLADNAVKYTPPGGFVRLRAIPYDMFCRIIVEDTGIGIPEAEQGKVFTRFYRSKEVQEEEGIGVGLYLARKIVAAQGGYIRLHAREEKGSVFSMYLPM